MHNFPSVPIQLSVSSKISFFKTVHGGARWRYFVITFCPTRLSIAFLLDSLSFLVGQRRNNGPTTHQFHRYCRVSLFSFSPSFLRFPLWIFFVHHRPIRIPKSLSVQMHNSRLCIPRNYCLSRLINADRFRAAILLAVLGYVREIRRMNSPMDDIYSCTQSCVTSLMQKARKPESYADWNLYRFAIYMREREAVCDHMGWNIASRIDR